MVSEEKTDLSYRLDEDTKEIVRNSLVPHWDKWDSVGDFTREAIQEEVSSLYKLATGGQVSRLLVRRLSDIRGIQEEQPSAAATAKIEGQELTEDNTVRIARERHGMLNDVGHETDLDPSQVARYCIFKHLTDVSQQSDQLAEWQERKVLQTWSELKNSLMLPKLRLHEIFTRRFRLPNSTTDFINYDQIAFGDFAEAYKEKFYGTEFYDQLTDIYDERTFGEVENAIEEYTDISLDSQSGYAADFLEDLDDNDEN